MPAIIFLVAEPPDNTARNDSPNKTKIAISGCPKAIIIGSINGTIASANNTGITPPAIELVTAAPMARAPSPLLVMGKPSSIVAALGAVPGIFNSMAVKLPPVYTTEVRATIKIRAISAGTRKRNGKIRGTITSPPMVGMTPITSPMKTATNNINRFIGWKSNCIPETYASNTI
jgi:hypothetical protein